MSSSVRTACAPSYGGGDGGGGGKRGRGDGGGGGGGDGGDDRRPKKPKPQDVLSAADFGPEGRLRRLILLLMQTANLGNLPSGGLLTHSGFPKTLPQRTDAVRSWVQGHLNAPNGLVQARYTELAESFVHVLRAASSAGLFDQMVAMLVELLTTRAEELADDDDEV
jgi:hypothetical protein